MVKQGNGETRWKRSRFDGCSCFLGGTGREERPAGVDRKGRKGSGIFNFLATRVEMVGMKSWEIWEEGNTRLERWFLEENLSVTFVPDDFNSRHCLIRKGVNFMRLKDVHEFESR